MGEKTGWILQRFTGQPLDPFATQNQVNQHFLPSHYTSTHLGLSSWPIRTDRTDQSMVPWTEAGTRQCESLRDAHATRHARMGARPRGRAGRSGHRIGGSERRSNGLCLVPKNSPQTPNFPSHLHHIKTLNIANDSCMEY